MSRQLRISPGHRSQLLLRLTTLCLLDLHQNFRIYAGHIAALALKSASFASLQVLEIEATLRSTVDTHGSGRQGYCLCSRGIGRDKNRSEREFHFRVLVWALFERHRLPLTVLCRSVGRVDELRQIHLHDANRLDLFAFPYLHDKVAHAVL